MTPLQLATAIVAFAFICGVFGSVLCGSRAQTIGFFLGLLLGPLGVIAAAIRGNRQNPALTEARSAAAADQRLADIVARLEPVLEIAREIRFHDEGVPAWIMASRADVLRLQEALRRFE